MKSVMIVFNHGLTEEVNDALDELKIRGYTRFLKVHGQGSEKGEPHLGTHIWPSENSALITVVDDGVVDSLLEKVIGINKEAEEQGIHAYVWNVEKMV